MNSNNNQINNTGETQNQFPGLVDKLTILPCTQERVAGLNTLEPEQQPATNGKQIERDNMYNLWRMNKTVDQVFDKNDGRKSAFFFGYPLNNFKSYFSGSNIFFGSSKKTCKDIKTEDKWKMYAEYINNSAMNNKPTTCVIVSHHNRMKKQGKTADRTDPLIPLKTVVKVEGEKDKNCNKECNAYANNFTVRIEIPEPGKNDDIKIEIVDPGFPDKGAFASTDACENDDEVTQTGGKKYLYCTKDSSNEIDVGRLKNWLKNAFSSSGQKGKVVRQKGKVVIYFIRHGNSIHNKPTNGKMVDSSLTYLGMIQAAQLGYNIANYQEIIVTEQELDKLKEQEQLKQVELKQLKQLQENPEKLKQLQENPEKLKQLQEKLEELNQQITKLEQKLNNSQDLRKDFIDPRAQPKVLLCGSFLSRTQLTGLIFLASLYRSCKQKNNNISNTNTITNITEVLTKGKECFGERLQDAWDYLMKTAVKNQQKYNSKTEKYKEYEPLKSAIPTDGSDKADKIYEALKAAYAYEDTTNRERIYGDPYLNNNNTNKGGRKTRKHKRKSRKMTRKVRVKRANKKASKKGHKKRSKRLRKM